MVIQYQGIPNTIPDNDASYFNLLRASIDGIDPGSAMSITNGPSGYIFRLIPSTSLYLDAIIKQLTDINSVMGIHLEFSKSSKRVGTITWKISF